MTLHSSVAAVLLLGAGATALPQALRADTPAGQPQMSDALASRVESRIAELHKRLGITPAQQPQWDAFSQAMRANAAHMDPYFQDRAALAKLNAVQGMRAYTAMVQAHAEDMQRLLPAFEALYRAMSPQQQRAADLAFRDFQQRLARHGPAQP